MDPLFECRNGFYLGNYQQCVAAGQKPNSDPASQMECKVFMYRALIAQRKYNTVVGEIQYNNSPPPFQLCSLLARYYQSESQRGEVLKQLQQVLSNPECTGNPTCLLLAAQIYYMENAMDNAMQLIYDSESLECMALMIQCLLKMNRPDVAQKEHKKMCQIDDDASITQLTNAWIHLSSGGKNYNEAFYIFQELATKYGSSCLLLNAQAVCLIHQHKFQEAEGLLQEALQKDSGDCDSLVNLIVVSRHLGKSDDVSKRYMNQLLDDFPNHPFSQQLKGCISNFDKCASMFVS